MKRQEYVPASAYNMTLASLSNPTICEACGAYVLAPVKHSQFHLRVDQEFYQSDALLSAEVVHENSELPE